MTVTAGDLDAAIACVMSGLLPADRPGLVGAGGQPGVGLLAYRRAHRRLPALLRLAARGPAHHAVRAGRGHGREGRLAGRGARVRRYRRAGPGLDGAHLPRAHPGLSPGRDGRPGGVRRARLPRGAAERQRHRAGFRPQPRAVARHVPSCAVPPVPAGLRPISPTPTRGRRCAGRAAAPTFPAAAAPTGLPTLPRSPADPLRVRFPGCGQSLVRGDIDAAGSPRRTVSGTSASWRRRC